MGISKEQWLSATGGFSAKRLLFLASRSIPAPQFKTPRNAHVVAFDIETELIRRGETPRPTIACAYSSKSKSYQYFAPSEFTNLIKLLRSADVVVTFNGESFDSKVIAKQLGSKGRNFRLLRSTDLYQITRKATGRAHSLNNLAILNFGTPKKSFGDRTPSLAARALRAACRSDVSQTLRLFRLYQGGRLKAPGIPITKRTYREMPFGGRCPICLDVASINELVPDYESLSERDEAHYMCGLIQTVRCTTCGTLFGRDGEEAGIQLTKSLSKIRGLRGEPNWLKSKAR